MLLNNLDKFTKQKIDVYTIFNLIALKRKSFILISILSILVGLFLYLSQKKIFDASIDIHLQSDFLMDKIVFKKIILKDIESINFLSESSNNNSIVTIEDEKLLLANLLSEEFLFLNNIEEVFDSIRTLVNLSDEGINFLKQIKSLNFSFIPIIKGGDSYKIRGKFSFLVSDFNYQNHKKLMNDFVIEYIEKNIDKVSNLYLQELLDTSKTISEILVDRNKTLINQKKQLDNFINTYSVVSLNNPSEQVKVNALNEIKTLTDELNEYDKNILKNEQILNLIKIKSNNFGFLLKLDRESYSVNNNFFGLLIIQIFSILLFNIIYLLCLLLKIGYNQNQEIYK